MKAIIYCRVSTKEQAEQGYSLEAQEKDCKEFALNKGYEVDRLFIERGESAKTQDRPELIKLLKYSFENKKQLSALIIWKYDRLARNLTDHLELINKLSSYGLNVLSVTENNDNTPSGRAIRSILGAVSQYENEIRGERTTKGMKEALLQGRWVFRVPKGYARSIDNKNKPMLIPSQESKYIKEIFKLAETGLYRQVDIVNMLRKQGYKELTENKLNRILRNPLYAGLIKVSWLPDMIEAIHEAIISKDTFYKVQLLLDGKRPSFAPRVRSNPDFPLRNFVKCSKCEKKLTGSWSKGRKNKYAYYHCRTKGCSLYVKKEALETSFYELLKSIQPSADILNLFEAIVLDVWKNKQAEQIKEEYRLEKELKALEEKKDRLDELIIKGTFDEATYKRKIEDINNDIIVKRTELNETKIELNDVGSCLNYCKAFMGNIANLWANAGLDLRQRFQSLVFPEGIAFDGEKFGTAKISPIFEQLQMKHASKTSLVALTGVEPVFTP